MALFEVTDLKKYYPIRKGLFYRNIGEMKAVDGVSFAIQPKEIVGLVGESGSGKSTVARTALHLIPPTSGIIKWMGQPIDRSTLPRLREEVQMVFQDPFSSLNPRKTVLQNIGEPLLYHKKVSSEQKMISEVIQVLQKTGLSGDILNHYPHQFSGGQQQRISIARALILRPKLIICDEAVSALDLTIQAQILNLLLDLKEAFGLSYLFISHDLSIVRYLCDRVYVMEKGKIVETGPTEALFKKPKHPYTQSLLASIPRRHPQEKRPSVK